ncbi:MAG TPA: LuxR C-terminal-related transcriptional regulator [Solirubrobacterales bacterium]|nr:LuxR C-terminal-related transcriptional regulator [Solirubrobacterales bacterium]
MEIDLGRDGAARKFENDIDGAASLVARPRLLRRLRESGDRTVLLCAPSGYGKSVLLGQWEAADPRTFLSILIGAHHNDAAALVAALVGAFAPVEPLAPEIGDALAAPQPDIERVVAPRLARSLAERRVPVVVALDEVERLESPDSLAVLATLAESLSPGSQLTLASRTEPAMHLARLRANRRLLELRREDLTLTKAECGSLIEGLGLSVGPRRLDALVARTEGWPAALYLAGSAIGEARDPGAAIAQFAGDDRRVVDYIREEMLFSVSRRRLDFLLRASVLERLSGPVCDAVLEREGSATVLRDLSRSNMLVIPLDRRDEWFRFHPLLREMLQEELGRADPAAERDLHLRASTCWEAAGDWDLAIGHAVAAGETARAGELVWAAVPEYMTRGRNASMVGWLDRLGEAAVRTSPGLSLTAAWSQLTLGRGPVAEHWAAVSRPLVEAEPASEYRTSLEVGLTLVDATLARDGVKAMRAAVAPARVLLPDESPWHSVCCLLDGVGLLLEGDRQGARAQLVDGSRRGSVGAPNLQVLCLAQLAVLAGEEGVREDAERDIARARAQIDRTGIGEYPMCALAFAVAAQVRAARGAVDAAAADLATAARLLDELDEFVPWYEIETRIMLARAAARLGDPQMARAMLDRAGREIELLGEATELDRWLEQAEKQLARQAEAAAGELTVAELRILRRLDSHLSIPQIAASIHLSPNTVKTHVRSIYTKFGVSSRRDAIEHARRTGLVDAPPPMPS